MEVKALKKPTIIMDIFSYIWIEKRFIFLFTTLISLLTLLYVQNAKYIYQSVATFRIVRLKENLSGAIAYLPLKDKLSFVETHKNMMLSDTILKLLIKKHSLEKKWDKKRKKTTILDDVDKDRNLKKLRKMIKFGDTKFTDLCSIYVRSDDKKEVALIANSLIKIYDDWMENYERKRYEKSSHLIEKKMLPLKKKFEEASEKIRIYKDKHGLSAVEEEIQFNLDALNKLTNIINELDSVIENNKFILSKLKDEEDGVKWFHYLTSDETLNQTYDQYTQLEQKITILKSYLQPEHPKYIDLKKKRNVLMKEIFYTMVDHLKSLIFKDETLKRNRVKLLSDYKKKNSVLEKHFFELKNMEKERELFWDKYIELFKRHEEVKLLLANRSKDKVLLISPGGVPSKRIHPWKTLIMIIGTSFGFLVSLIVAIMKQLIKIPDEV